MNSAADRHRRGSWKVIEVVVSRDGRRDGGGAGGRGVWIRHARPPPSPPRARRAFGTAGTRRSRGRPRNVTRLRMPPHTDRAAVTHHADEVGIAHRGHPGGRPPPSSCLPGQDPGCTESATPCGARRRSCNRALRPESSDDEQRAGRPPGRGRWSSRLPPPAREVPCPPASTGRIQPLRQGGAQNPPLGRPPVRATRSSSAAKGVAPKQVRARTVPLTSSAF